MSWNQFQKEFANKGYSDSTKSLLYNRLKNYVINPKESDETNIGKYSTFTQALRESAMEPWPILKNPDTERQVRIQKYGMIINLSKERQRKEKKLKETTDVQTRELLQNDIQSLNRLIEKLVSVLPTPPDLISPEGLWQQFEHEMSVSSGKLFSKRQLSEMYEAIKADVLSGKYPNFIQAMRAYKLSLIRAKALKSAKKEEPGSLVIEQPAPLIKKPEQATIFAPKTLQEIQSEVKKDLESRREEMSLKIKSSTDSLHSIQERREAAIIKFNKENELRMQIKNFLKIKKALLLEGKLDEVADVDTHLETLKQNLQSLKDE